MSRLRGTGSEPEGGSGPDPATSKGVSLVIVSGFAIAVVMAAVLALAALFAHTSSGGELPFMPSTTTTSTSSTTTSTTSTTSTTTSSTTSTTSTTLEIMQTTTTTSSTTTSTISRYQIAACMADRIDELYLSENTPSKRVELYLGEYESFFNIESCKSREEREDCNEALEEYLEENDLMWHDYRTVDRVGYYPVAVLGGKAYIIPSTDAFDKLIGCGSLDE